MKRLSIFWVVFWVAVSLLIIINLILIGHYVLKFPGDEFPVLGLLIIINLIIAGWMKAIIGGWKVEGMKRLIILLVVLPVLIKMNLTSISNHAFDLPHQQAPDILLLSGIIFHLIIISLEVLSLLVSGLGPELGLEPECETSRGGQQDIRNKE